MRVSKSSRSGSIFSEFMSHVEQLDADLDAELDDEFDDELDDELFSLNSGSGN